MLAPAHPSEVRFLLTVRFLHTLPYASVAAADQSAAVGCAAAPGDGNIDTLFSVYSE